MVNLKLAARTLAKSPFVTAVAIVSLALGIGANAAIYSLFNQILLRPLPVAEPAQLVNLSAPGPKPGSTSCNQAGECANVFSYPMFRDLEAKQTAFAGIAGHRLFGANLAFNNQTLNAEGVLVTGSYFPTLGLRPALGRLLTPDDDRTPGAHTVVVLSHGFWQNQYGGDPKVVGEAITVNGRPMTIIGVAPARFEGTTLGARPRVFVPISMRNEIESYSGNSLENRRSYWMYVFARLKPGTTLTQAQTAINGTYRPILTEVEAPLQEGMSEQTMQRFRAKEIALADGRRGQSSIHGESRTPLLMLFAITGIVLLIACANIANLLLARGATRSAEMAVRLSLGAKRRQLLAQLLGESVLLALLGGAASLVVAQLTLTAIGSMLPDEAATVLELRLDPSVIWFAGALSVGTGILFGLFPALQSTRPDLITTIRASAGQLAGGARAAARFRAALVTAQIALSMALLVSAGLFIRSLLNVSKVDLGLDAENVVMFAVSPQLNGYDRDRSRQLFLRLEEELAAVPGVTGVTTGLVALVSGNNWGNDVSVEGFERGPDTDANSRFNEVGPGYFRTLGVPMLSGREFTAGDERGTQRVAIVNEAFARKFNLGRDAVGRYMAVGGGDSLDIQIVGVVKDAKYDQVKDEVPPVYFTSWRQNEELLGFRTFYARTTLPPEQLLRQIPALVKRIDPQLPVETLRTLPQQVRENVFLDRMIGTLSASFAALATLLAAVGLYGVLAYTVAQRTREIGVRMALGAHGGQVRRLVMRQVGWMVLVGGGIGLAAAVGLGRAAQSLLYGLQGTDPVVMGLSIVMLLLVALGAGYVPARRASRVDPMHALRYE